MMSRSLSFHRDAVMMMSKTMRCRAEILLMPSRIRSHRPSCNSAVVGCNFSTLVVMMGHGDDNDSDDVDNDYDDHHHLNDDDDADTDDDGDAG